MFQITFPTTIQDQAQEEQQNGPPADLAQNLDKFSPPSELTLHGEVQRRAHDPHEPGEDQIG